jgi:hypothetical protein
MNELIDIKFKDKIKQCYKIKQCLIVCPSTIIPGITQIVFDSVHNTEEREMVIQYFFDLLRDNEIKPDYDLESNSLVYIIDFHNWIQGHLGGCYPTFYTYIIYIPLNYLVINYKRDIDYKELQEWVLERGK